ncbi:prolipoprotein diacylglyceryl transferase [Pseudaestuariivita atlantica]|uniref:Phosphatidylglycerol--prolipoprotein diacylglyceryl transferase n=1 Tax=Pseudaestuariivita atlantica TaxID=1317121 RepID=A0A0L1JTK3_9RHOB|nr:prolipoprotein diacylglyceryl transferase [Pseudaestuariivita atlantica]KNG95075.1 diacylglyceryl transferase [Pseudaestuariivita atlantica]
MQAAIPFPPIAPEIFSISVFGIEFALRWYALAYIVGIIIGWRLAAMAVKTPRLWPGGRAPMTPTQVEDLLTYIILGVILGGRLGFVLFYRPFYYLQNPVEILMLWEGGMSFHGGFLGVGVAIWLYCRAQKVPLAPACDLIAMATPPGLLLGRLANFINAELWGRPTDLPWGVIFPGQLAQACGQVAGACARHPSQLYEAALEGLILGAVLLWLAWRRRAFFRPWLATGVFFVGYGAARFLVEFVRQPDIQFVSDGNPLGLALHVGGYGLTQGQVLSLPMILVGALLVRAALRRPAQTA